MIEMVREIGECEPRRGGTAARGDVVRHVGRAVAEAGSWRGLRRGEWCDWRRACGLDDVARPER